jgi:hypothetical protein
LITAPSIGEGQDHATVNSARPTFTVSATDERSGIRSVRFEVAADVLPLDWKTISTDVDPDAGTATYTVVWPFAVILEGPERR